MGNKRYLDKVVDQLVSETRIDYYRGEMYLPFLLYPFPLYSYSYLSTDSFSSHCKNVYGLNKSEIYYVWKEYKEIIKDKIKSNGL